MPRFKHYNYDQDTMVVINYQEQLQPGTFEHAAHYLIEHKLDLSVFHPKYRTGQVNCRAILKKKISPGILTCLIGSRNQTIPWGQPLLLQH